MSETAFQFDLQLFADGDGDGGGSGEGGNVDGDPAGEGGNEDRKVDFSDPKIYGEKHVKSIHDENARFRHQNRELTKKLKEYEEANAAADAKKLEENGEFKKLADEAEKRARKAEKESAARIENMQKKTIRMNARALLVAEGILDADDVALLDFSDVSWDDEADEPKGLEAAVKAFKKAKPGKFKAGDGTGSADPGKDGDPGNKRAQNFIPSGQGNNGKGEDARNWDDKRLKSEWDTIRL